MNSRHYYHKKLVAARELRGKTQQEIAEAIKVDRQTIYRAESGKNASYDLLVNLCNYYGIPMHVILNPAPSSKTVSATI